MNSKERLLRTLQRKPADCVPFTPDVAHMIPARLTGKPFWDISLYEDPPLWKAQIACAKYFNFDGFVPAKISFPFEESEENPWETAIVERNERRIVTQRHREANGSLIWEDCVTVYPVADPPTRNIRPISKIGLPDVPDQWEPLEGVRQWPTGPELFELVYQEMGDQGIVGVSCGSSVVVRNPDEVVEYFTNPEKYRERPRRSVQAVERRFEAIMAMPRKPDFVACGGSGTLIWRS